MKHDPSALIDIVIVNWNSGPQLYNCILSIERNGSGLFRKIIVVDNGSSDQSLKNLDEFEDLLLVKKKDNLGFAKACNVGAQFAEGKYILFLNPDAMLYEDTLDKTLTFMDHPQNSHIGICGVRLLDDQGLPAVSAARFPTLRVMLGTSLNLSKIASKIFPSHLMNSNELNINRYVDQVIGAYFFVRKSVFDMCNGFDEDFFVYFEEVDFSLRAKKLGFQSYYLADVFAYHKGGGCSDRVKDVRLFYSLRSRLIYARKHYSFFARLALVLLTIIEFPLRAARGLFRGSWSDIKNTFSAYFMLARYFWWGEHGSNR